MWTAHVEGIVWKSGKEPKCEPSAGPEVSFSNQMSEEEMNIAEACMSRSRGHCAVMGTASTMAVMAEALGLTLPDNAAIPAA